MFADIINFTGPDINLTMSNASETQYLRARRFRTRGRTLVNRQRINVSPCIYTYIHTGIYIYIYAIIILWTS